MEKKLSTLLAGQWSLTNPEEEPYILTPEEEETVVQNEVDRLKKNYAWKMANAGMQEGEILYRLSVLNWEEEINRAEVLQRANSNKHYGIWQKEQRDKEKQEAAIKYKELIEKCSAKYMFRLMSWTSQHVYGKRLLVNEDNKSFITTLCFFLSRDPRFETELGFSFKKGLMIRGVSGLGKTHLVKCLADNELNPIHILSMIEITDKIKRDGEYAIELGDRKIVYLDDVGTEEHVVNFFGTKITFFKDFIEVFYLKNKPFNTLIISTNNSFQEIEEKYGFRVRSRAKDMFNIVDVKGVDMRG